jgi:hypothetical protein
MAWILIIWIGSDLWVPIQAYPSADDCYAVLEKWDLQPGIRASCLRGEIEIEKSQQKRRK